MPKFCANLSLLYGEHPFLDRFAAAASDGFTAVEYQFPYAFDRQRIADVVAEQGLSVVLHNLPAGDWAAGDRGLAALPQRVGEFRDGVGVAIDYALATGCRQLNCLAGVLPPGQDAERAGQTLIDNLRFAASALRGTGIRLLLEAINTRDVPGFFLGRSAQAVAVIEAAGADELWLQYDLYHMHIMEGDLAAGIAANLSRIAHMQLADAPGRHEPGTGVIEYPALFDLVDELGYPGWIGCEYQPLRGTSSQPGVAAPMAPPRPAGRALSASAGGQRDRAFWRRRIDPRPRSRQDVGRAGPTRRSPRRFATGACRTRRGSEIPMTAIRISWSSGSLVANLRDTPTTRRLVQALPLSGAASLWGDEVYFGLPFAVAAEPDAATVVEPGAVCFWLAGNALALPFGPTPVSQGEECRLISPANLLGQIEGDCRRLSSVRAGERVHLAVHAD